MSYTLSRVSNHILKIVFFDDITDEDAIQSSIDIDQLIDTTAVVHPIYFIINAADVGKISAKARQIFATRNKNEQITGTAIYGVSRTIRVLGLFLAKASRRDNIYFFDQEAEALAWLQQKIAEFTNPS